MADKKQGKAIFIEAMKNYLPRYILESEKKKVWLTPASEWLRKGLNSYAKEVLSFNYCSETQKYFNFKGIEEMFNQHINKEKYNLNLIWALIAFQIWCKDYL